ncbi:hypothetical protein Tco_0786004, partial [Tanacetum coccineum]
GIGSSMYKTKMDTNQSSSSQSGGDAQVDHSKSTHEVDGGKKKTTTTTTSTHVNVNRDEGDKAHSESKDEGFIISPNAVFEDDDDHSEAFLAVGEVRVTKQCEVLFAMGKYKDMVLFDIVDMDCHVLLGRPWQSDLNVVHKGNENTYTFSKGGRKFTLRPYSDEVQATTTKEKKNHIMLCSTRSKEKNICATTILPDKVLNPIMYSWSSYFQEGENDGGPKLKKGIKDDPGRIKLD